MVDDIGVELNGYVSRLAPGAKYLALVEKVVAVDTGYNDHYEENFLRGVAFYTDTALKEWVENFESSGSKVPYKIVKLAGHVEVVKSVSFALKEV